eukprot:scaffold14568_cov91-Skeletonema_dohrnii-CCMP3373.AAC.3
MKARRCAWNPSKRRQDFWGRTGHFIGHDGTPQTMGGGGEQSELRVGVFYHLKKGIHGGDNGFLAATT